jgi:hypothetical protein
LQSQSVSMYICNKVQGFRVKFCKDFPPYYTKVSYILLFYLGVYVGVKLFFVMKLKGFLPVK